MNQFIITLIAYARSYFGGLLLFKTDAIISILDRFLLILFCGVLIYTPITETPFKIEWFIWIQTLCYGITLAVASVIIFTKLGVPKLKFDSKYSYDIIKKSFPYALLIFLMIIYTRLDSVRRGATFSFSLNIFEKMGNSRFEKIIANIKNALSNRNPFA